jgi:outer membrane lipoprotein SlyB
MHLPLAIALVLGLGLGACGQDSVESDDGPASTAAASSAAETATTEHKSEETVVAARNDPPAVCRNCGTISNIEQRTEKGEATGMGAVAGAILGAVAGREIVGGKRSHRDAAAVAGAVGGGYAGHQIEKKARSTTYYLVTVRMDDGRSETVTLNSTEGLSIGQKVRVEDGNIILS